MTKFTNTELQFREAGHRANAETGIHVTSWQGKSKLQCDRESQQYKEVQLKLANAFEELRKYREADPNYTEEEDKE